MKNFPSLLRLFAFALLIASAPAALHAQTDDTTPLGKAIKGGNDEATKLLDPKTFTANSGGGSSTLTPDQFFQNHGMDVPVLLDRLSTPMRRFGQRVIIGFWTFYTSQWWQISVKSILVLCAFLGLWTKISDIVHGNVNPAQAWREVLFKFGLAGFVFQTLAPNVPFVLTRTINSMVNGMSFVPNDADSVRYHQQAFFRRAIEIEAKAAMVMNGRLDNQYYSDASLAYPYGDQGAVPEAVSPSVKTPDNTDARAVTALSFLYVSPPTLGKQYQKQISGTQALYLLAPAALRTAPDKIVRIQSFFFNPYSATSTTVRADENTAQDPDNLLKVADPLSSSTLSIPIRPFGAAVLKSLEIYQRVFTKWPDLKAAKTHTTTLTAADQVVEQVLTAASDALLEDMLTNQTFALTPDFSGIWDDASEAAGADAYIAATRRMSQMSASDKADLEAKQTRFRDFYERIGKSLAADIASIKSHELNGWTYEKIIPLGLLFCNAYIILFIWLLPPLLCLWACFLLLPPFFDISNALKRGGAGIIALILYPVFLQLILLFCFALADAGNALDDELDPNRNLAKLAIYGMLPSSGAPGVAMQVATTAGKTQVVNSLAGALDSSHAGLGTLVVWIVILFILVASPGIVAKFIMGMGAADALAQPVQTGATMGAGIGAKAMGAGVASAASDVGGAVSAGTNSLSRMLPR